MALGVDRSSIRYRSVQSNQTSLLMRIRDLSLQITIHRSQCVSVLGEPPDGPPVADDLLVPVLPDDGAAVDPDVIPPAVPEAAGALLAADGDPEAPSAGPLRLCPKAPDPDMISVAAKAMAVLFTKDMVVLVCVNAP